MKNLLIGVAALGIAALVHATPVVIEESSRIALPPGGTALWGQVAIDGDDAVALDYYSYPVDDSEDPDYETITTAHLYHRSGSNWVWVRQLAQGDDNSADDATNHNPIAMKNGVLALAFEPMMIFERENGTWVQKRAGPPPGQLVIYHEPAREVRIDSGRIFLGSAAWGGAIYVKNASTGNWEGQAWLPGDDAGDGDNSVGGDIDLAPNWAVVASPYNWNELPAPAMHVFHRSGTTWPLQARLVPEPGHTFGDVAIRDNELFIGDLARYGVGVWRRDSSSQWYRADNLRTAGDFNGPGPYGEGSYGGAIFETANYVFKQQWNEDRAAFVVNVFQPDTSGAYRHVATLAAKNGDNLGDSIAVYYRHVLVNGEHGPYYFLLPETFAPPALFQDTFAGSSGSWTAIAGSQFAIVQSGNSRVFRQSSTVGDAGAVLDGYDWTNQSIQADVKPTAINGTSAWVGLATRHLDASNYYYVTLRNSGAIQLKRHGNNGTLVTLASASVPWTLNRTYRLRLESVGSLQRVYVDGTLLLEAWDSTIKHGQPALLSYRAAVDYDNVVVSPTDIQTIYAPAYANVWDPPQLQPEPWTYSGGGKWSWQYDVDSNLIFKQTYTNGDARAAVGPPQIPNTNQIVEARIRPRVFSTTGSPWAGLMARYVDAQNYVYVQLRDSNVLRLRKLKNGTVVDLGTATLTVTPNTWYAVRLEAIGANLRAYVDGKLVLEVTDPEPVSGLVGLVTYRTAADYDDFRAVVP